MKNILKSFLVVAVAAFGFASAHAADLKVGSVSLEKLFNEYHMTKKIQAQVKKDQARIQESNAKRLENIRAIQSEIEKLSKQRNDATLSDKKRLELERQIKLKYSEGNAADNERRQWLQRQSKTLAEQAGEEQKAILKKIEDLISNHAREQDFDIIVDSSARSSSRTQIFAFVKDKFDVTDELLKQLNKDAPKEEPKAEEAATPAAAPAP